MPKFDASRIAFIVALAMVFVALTLTLFVPGFAKYIDLFYK